MLATQVSTKITRDCRGRDRGPPGKETLDLPAVKEDRPGPSSQTAAPAYRCWHTKFGAPSGCDPHKPLGLPRHEEAPARTVGGFAVLENGPGF
jgi:hypothetical protein